MSENRPKEARAAVEALSGTAAGDASTFMVPLNRYATGWSYISKVKSDPSKSPLQFQSSKGPSAIAAVNWVGKVLMVVSIAVLNTLAPSKSVKTPITPSLVLAMASRTVVGMLGASTVYSKLQAVRLGSPSGSAIGREVSVSEPESVTLKSAACAEVAAIATKASRNFFMWASWLFGSRDCTLGKACSDAMA